MLGRSGLIRNATALTLAALAMAPALAHTGGSLHAHGGFGSGFAHPLMGLDHLLAMLAVGIWAAQSRRAALWVLPLVFPLAMAAGALLALNGVTLPAVEAGIAASVVVLGLLIAFAVKMPLWAGAVVVSLFALVHGHAHGAEVPAGASVWMYGAGFLLATLLLHMAGLGSRLLVESRWTARLVRLVGVAFAMTGVFMFAA